MQRAIKRRNSGYRYCPHCDDVEYPSSRHVNDCFRRELEAKRRKQERLTRFASLLPQRPSKQLRCLSPPASPRARAESPSCHSSCESSTSFGGGAGSAAPLLASGVQEGVNLLESAGSESSNDLPVGGSHSPGMEADLPLWLHYDQVIDLSHGLHGAPRPASLRPSPAACDPDLLPHPAPSATTRLECARRGQPIHSEALRMSA
jgi:hypothetical protein